MRTWINLNLLMLVANFINSFGMISVHGISGLSKVHLNSDNEVEKQASAILLFMY